MITSLDDPSALDPERVGAKAAALAQARQAGLPVLPGFVVETSASLAHMELGSSQLGARGSGGARLAVSVEPLPETAQIERAGRQLGATLAVRSSSLLESDAAWAGAFTSYLGVTAEELPKAVAGCWASAFSVDALNRQLHAGIEPGSVPMAVLVQPFVEADAGGVAEISPDGTLWVEAVAGPPGLLLQGWESGVSATRRPAEPWEGAKAIEMVGIQTLDEIGSVLGAASEHFGFTRCEWGMAGSLWILQVGAVARPRSAPRPTQVSTPPELVDLVRALITAPGVLGAELVLPWAVAGLPAWGPTQPVHGEDLLDQASDLSESLTSHVWGLPSAEALRSAQSLFTRLRGPNPEVGIATIRSLNPPHPDQSNRLLATLHALDTQLVTRGILPRPGGVWHLSPTALTAALDGEQVTVPRRIGVSVWEPLAAAVVLDHGTSHQGVPAAAGVGVGLRHAVGGDEQGPPPRAVITAPNALPSLSQLIWDAAGLVTALGSPAAHVFESARSHGVPAVCGVDLVSDGGEIVAVDGYSGLVASLPLTPGR